MFSLFKGMRFNSEKKNKKKSLAFLVFYKSVKKTTLFRGWFYLQPSPTQIKH